MKLALVANSFSERGESAQFIALSKALLNLYGVESLITFEKDSLRNNWERVEEARDQGLEVSPYRNRDHLEEIVNANRVTHVLSKTDGSATGAAYCRDEPWRFRLGDTVHITQAVFRNFEPHGDFYLYVSDWLYDWARRKHVFSPQIGKKTVTVGALPHGVEATAGSKTNFTKEFNLPSDSFVIGRIGGRTEFSDSAAKRAVLRILDRYESSIFLAVNTERFTNHPRVRYLDYLPRKAVWDFYATTDLLINGRLAGESFGFSIAEPLSVGKPVIAPHWLRNPRMDRNHLRLLPSQDERYYSAADLERKISNKIRRHHEDTQSTSQGPFNREDLKIETVTRRLFEILEGKGPNEHSSAGIRTFKASSKFSP